MSKARQLADLGNVYDDGALSNRNMVINGDMQVAQRGTSATGASSGLSYHTNDRFYFGVVSLGTWTVTQEADGPSGFSNSMKVECTTASASPASNGLVYIGHRLEGQNLQQIAKGTADAKPLVLSFWVKSNVTGTYQVSFVDNDNTRMVAGTYSVSSSGTWEYKTIDVAADTTGAFHNDNGNSLQIEWWLGSGTNYTTGTAPAAWEARDNTDRNAGSNVNVGDTIGNYFQLTGVQLEVGDTATPFEHRSYADELQRCKRYYEGGTYAERENNGTAGRWWAGDVLENGNRAFPSDRKFAVEKRATPTISIESAQTGTADKLSGYSSGIEYTCTAVQGTSRHEICTYFQMSGSGTGALPDQYLVAYIEVDAEL